MLSLQTVTEVAKPEVNAEVAYTMDGETKVYVKPTYVSGKTVQFLNRTNKTNNPYQGIFSFTPVTAGKFVFSGDLYFTTSAQPIRLTFCNNEGNKVIDLHWDNGSSTRKFNFEYTNGEGTWTIGESSIGYCDYRNFKGYGE